MKRVIAGLGLVVALALLGCEDKGKVGGPAATGERKKPMVGASEDTFQLSVPTLSTSIKQGETKSITVGIKRGKSFDQDVSLKVSDLPKGVTADPMNTDIKHGDTEAKIDLKAADDAAIGDFEVKVTGHPSRGADATNEFKITVKKK